MLYYLLFFCSSSELFLLQGIELPECRLLVALRYQEDLDCDLAADVRIIAKASAILQQKGLELCVQLEPPSADHALPPPNVLAQLAPVIQRIKYSKLKTHSPGDAGRAHCFSAAHISALSNATTSLQELCISDYRLENWNDIMSDASMTSIATFSCLTRLDLICSGDPALQTLGQLSHLQKLALQLNCEGVAYENCCEAVLLSNNTGLRKIELDSHAWSDATYLALLTLTNLKVLTVNISAISSSSAGVLGNVDATRGISICFYETYVIADCVLQGLTSSCANITALHLGYIPFAKFQHVCTMEHLSSLTIFRPNSFTGFELVTQPKLSHLELVCCYDLDTAGLRHIVCVFPELTSIRMVAEPKEHLVPWPVERVDSFVEISQLRKLELVDLSGLGNITADQAEALKCAIRAQQELGLLQPNVRLVLQVCQDDVSRRCCVHLFFNSSQRQVFSETKPNEQLEVAFERYLHQQRAKAGAKLMLRCYMTATLVKAAFRFVAKVSRVL